MSRKMQNMAKNLKKHYIFFIIVWLIFAILFVAPIAIAIARTVSGGADFILMKFIEYSIAEISSFTGITRVFTSEYLPFWGKTMLFYTLAYIVLIMIGVYKAAPKHEYTNIEHGSSDWSENRRTV